MNHILDYWDKIQSGDIVVGQHIKKIYQTIVHDLDNPGAYTFDIDKATKPIEFVEFFCKQSKGQWIGKAFILDLWQKAMIQVVFGFVDAEGRRKYKEVFTLIGRKNGKAENVDNLIPTVEGFKTVRDLEIGDFVFNDCGKPVRVLAKSQVFNEQQMEVVFNSGEVVKVHPSHEWQVEYLQKHKRVKSILETRSLKDLLEMLKAKRQSVRILHTPTHYPEKALEIDPYILGLWLGNGFTAKGPISVGFQDIDETIKNVEKRGYQVYSVRNDSGGANKIMTIRDANNIPLQTKLRKSNLLNNKNIPQEYLTSSIEQRYELLRGLMDTDGYISKLGECEFVQHKKEIIDSTKLLLNSLGIKAKVIYKDIPNFSTYAYRLNFFPLDTTVFSLPRKQKKEKLTSEITKKNYFYLREIHEIENGETQCIEVEGGMYKTSTSFITTHNSSLLSALGLYMLIGDGEGGAEVYSVATKKDQAKIISNEAVNIVRQSDALSRHLRKNITGLYFDATFSKFAPLASDSNSLDGLNTHFCMIDEIHAIKDRNLYDVMVQSMATRQQPMLWCITTSGFVRENIFDTQYKYAVDTVNGLIPDEHFIAFLYELDKDDDYKNQDVWSKANPGLGTIKSLEFLRDSVNKSKVDPAFKATVLTKDFNITSTTASAFLEYSTIRNEETFTPDEIYDVYCVGGVDLSSTTDLTSATILVPKPEGKFLCLQQYWMPWMTFEEAEHSKQVVYQAWVDRGLLTLIPGNRIDYGYITQWFVSMKEDRKLYFQAIGYDSWNSVYWVKEMELRGFGGVMEIVQQGAKTLSTPLKNLGADLATKKINYNKNPLLEYCLCNLGCVYDRNNNITPVKTRSRGFIDGAMSLLDAYVSYERHKELIDSLL